jgi:hypothetical protein
MILMTQTGINAHMVSKDNESFSVERLRCILFTETVQMQRLRNFV